MRQIEGEIIHVEKGVSTIDFHTLGLPFGGPYGGRDMDGEFFSPRTNFGIEKGHMLPTTYFHGRNERGMLEAMPEFLGKSEYMGIQEKGGWFMSRVNKSNRRAQKLYTAGRENRLRASTSLAGKLRRILPSGELLMWVPGAIALIDKTKNKGAINDFAISTPVLKALYIDNGLEWAEVDHESSRTIEPTRKILVSRKKRILVK